MLSTLYAHKGSLRLARLVGDVFVPDNRNLQSEGMSNICLPIRKMMETIGVSASYSRKLDRELCSL